MALISTTERIQSPLRFSEHIETNYANGKEEGLYQQWHENGQLSRYCYKAGEETYMSYCTKDKQS